VPQLPEERKATVKKWFRGSLGSKALLPCRFVGYHKDRKGIVWRVYSPTVNQLSAWARLETDGRRGRFVYDPGYHWRSTLSKRRPTTHPCWSENL